MKKIFICLLFSILMISCVKKEEISMDYIPDDVKGLTEQVTEPKKGEEIAVLHTTEGDIKIKLFPEKAPKAVENFKTHIKNKYYDGVIFHRVIKDFMIQSGDPEGTGMGGESIYGQGFETEYNEDLIHIRGALSMANTGQPNSNGSQFFIVQADKVDDQVLTQMKDFSEEGKYPVNSYKLYKSIGGTYFLDGKHPVFGQVIIGMDVVDKIANAETDANDRPKTEIKITSAEIIEY